MKEEVCFTVQHSSKEGFSPANKQSLRQSVSLKNPLSCWNGHGLAPSLCMIPGWQWPLGSVAMVPKCGEARGATAGRHQSVVLPKAGEPSGTFSQPPRSLYSRPFNWDSFKSGRGHY